MVHICRDSKQLVLLYFCRKFLANIRGTVVSILRKVTFVYTLEDFSALEN